MKILLDYDAPKIRQEIFIENNLIPLMYEL